MEDKSELEIEFEKTGGVSRDELYLYEGFDAECYNDEYVEWLENLVRSSRKGDV